MAVSVVLWFCRAPDILRILSCRRLDSEQFGLETSGLMMATMMTVIKTTTMKAMKHIFFFYIFFGIGASIRTPWDGLVLKQYFSKTGKVH